MDPAMCKAQEAFDLQSPLQHMPPVDSNLQASFQATGIQRYTYRCPERRLRGSTGFLKAVGIPDRSHGKVSAQEAPQDPAAVFQVHVLKGICSENRFNRSRLEALARVAGHVDPVVIGRLVEVLGPKLSWSDLRRSCCIGKCRVAFA